MQSLANELKLLKKQEQLEKITDLHVDENTPSRIKILLPYYDPHPKMLAWHNARQRHKGIKGGKRAGKTYTLGAEAIDLSYVNRPLYHLSLSPSYANACETVVPNLEDLCVTNGLTYDWKISKNLFLIVWGKKKSDIAQILIHGMDSCFDGVTAASGDLNEPFLIKKSKFLVWWERISHPKAKRLSQVWGGTAQPKEMQWGFEYFKEKKYDLEDFYADTLTTFDNKHLDPMYIKQLEKKYTEKQKRVFLLGECMALTEGDAVYESFDETLNTFNPLTFKIDYSTVKFSELVLNYDFNCRHMSVGLHELSGRWKLKREEYRIENKSNTKEITRLAITKMINDGYLIKKADGFYWTKFNTSIIITGDACGEHGSSQSKESDYEIIMEEFDSWNVMYTMHVAKKNPPVRDRTNYINLQFENGTYLISVNCEYAIKDRNLTSWKEGAKGFEIDKSKSELTHMSDSDDYGLWYTRIITDEAESDSEGSEPSIYTSLRDRRRR